MTKLEKAVENLSEIANTLNKVGLDYMKPVCSVCGTSGDDLLTIIASWRKQRAALDIAEKGLIDAQERLESLSKAINISYCGLEPKGPMDYLKEMNEALKGV